MATPLLRDPGDSHLATPTKGSKAPEMRLEPMVFFCRSSPLTGPESLSYHSRFPLSVFYPLDLRQFRCLCAESENDFSIIRAFFLTHNLKAFALFH